MDSNAKMNVDGLEVSGIREVNVSFPGNSKHSKEQKDQPREVKKVTSGTVISKKPSIGRRIIGSFVNSDCDSVLSYVVGEVLVPAAKKTICEMVEGTLDMIFYNGERSTRRSGRGSSSRVSYSSYYDSVRDRPSRQSRGSSIREDLDDIILETRSDGEAVITQLLDLIEEYGQASVHDLYEALGMDSPYTNNKWGWTSLGGADVKHVRDGYKLILPKPRPIDQ